MTDIGFGGADFGGGLVQPGATPDGAMGDDGSGMASSPAQRQPVQPPAISNITFGGGLFGRKTAAYEAGSSLQPSGDPMQDRINSVQAARDVLQRRLNNPLRAFLKPQEYQQDLQQAGQLDQQIFGALQAIQQQKDLRGLAMNTGIDPVWVNTQGPTLSQQTILNKQTEDYSSGAYRAKIALMGAGDAGKNIINENEGNFISGLSSRNNEADEVITRLNAAGGNQAAYSAALNDMKANGIDPSKVLGNYVPNFVVPDKVDAWQARSRGAIGTLAKAKQEVAQYNQKQAAIGGQVQPIADEKQAGAIGGSLFRGSRSTESNGAIEGGSGVTLPSGDSGWMLNSGSNIVDNYGKPGAEGWNNETQPKVDSFNKLLGDEQVKGAVERYKKSAEYWRTVNEPGMFNSPQGVAMATDKLMGMARSIVETSGASGNASFNRIMDQKYGGVQKYIDHATNEIGAVKDWLNGHDPRAKVGDDGQIYINGQVVQGAPRISAQTIRGFKDVAAFEHSDALGELKSRLGGALFNAGRNGIPLSHTALGSELQADSDVQSMHDSGVQSYKNDVNKHPFILRGDQRILLQQDSTNSEAKKPTPPPINPANSGKPVAPASYAPTAIMVESGGKPGQVTGSYKGLGQFSDEEMHRHGITNPDDPKQVTAALNADYAQNKAAITKATGIIPSDTQVYLAHQQGLGGITAHMVNPDAPAWANMASTAEGQRKGEDWAKRAVWGNVPNDMKAVLARNGVNANNLTSRDFMSLWTAKFQHIAQRIGAAYTAPGQTAVTGNVNNVQPEFNPDVQKARGASGEIPASTSTMGAAVGTGVGGPVGGVVGGAAGGFGGKVLQNYGEGKPLLQGTAKETALGGVQGFAPGSRPIFGAIARSVGAGAVGATSAASEGATLGNAIEEGAKTAALNLGGEGAFGVVGLALGRSGMIYNKFTDATKAELNEAGAIIAKGKPDAPKSAAGMPVSETAKAEYEAATQKYEDAVQKAKDHGLVPEDLAHAVNQIPAGQAAVQKVVDTQKAALGERYQAMKADVGATAVGTPKQVPLDNGPLSLVGKHPDVPAPVKGSPTNFAMDRATQAENNITAPAKNWEEKYQQIFEERSKLLAEQREAMPNGANPDANKARTLGAIADNVGDQQRAMLKYVYGPRGNAMANKLDALHRDYAEFMNATKGGDIIENMAKPGAEGAHARNAFNKFAGDDQGAKDVAAALLRARSNPASNNGRNAKFMVTAIAGALGFHLPAAALLVPELPKMLNEWAGSRAAGAPVTLKKMMVTRIRQAQAQARANASAAAGRATQNLATQQ